MAITNLGNLGNLDPDAILKSSLICNSGDPVQCIRRSRGTRRPRVPIAHHCCCILFASLILSLIVFVDCADEARPQPTFSPLGMPHMQVLESSRAVRSPPSPAGDPMPFAALACLFAIINLGSVVRLVGCALLGGPKMKRRPWQVVICCISYLASLAVVVMFDSMYGTLWLLLL
jgi:hypothetical protein